jgi:gliding motility-associated-like protein
MKKALLFLLVLFCLFSSLDGLTGAKAQTTMVAGDMAVIRYNEDLGIDGFSVVTLVGLQSGTQFYVTDQGWRGSFGWSANDEMHAVLTLTAAMPAGTVFHFEKNGNSLDVRINNASAIAYNLPSTRDINFAGGDQVIVYQGSKTTPTFITGLNSTDHGELDTYGFGTSDVTTKWASENSNLTAVNLDGAQTSRLPQGLTNGVNAISLFYLGTLEDTETLQNAYYSGTLTGTKTQLSTAINNRANWTFPNAEATRANVGAVPTGVLTVTGTAVALSTNPTLTFTNSTGLTTKTTDGTGGSTAISDLDLEIFAGNKTTGAVLPLSNMEWRDATWFSSINGFTGVTPNPADVTTNGFEALVIKSASQSSNFALNALRIIDWGGISPVMIAAYDGGTLLGSVELSLPSNGTAVITDRTSELTGIFNNVDEVRIYSKSGDNIWLGVNNINLGPSVVDVIAPTVTSITRENVSPNNLTEVIFSAFFSEAVTGVDINDFATVGVSATVNSITSLPGNRYNISVNNISGSGTLGLNLKTSGTGIADLAGNAISGGLVGPVYIIDQTAPTASIVVADNDLLADETSLVTITFNEAVTGFTLADLTVANGTLTSLSSTDGGIIWTATLTPSPEVNDPTNLIILANSGVQDAVGNVGTGTTSSNNYFIRTRRPIAGIVVVDNALSIGETSLVVITFNRAISGFTLADLTAVNGTLTGLSSADGGITWTATLTPTAGITDASNTIALDNTGIHDSFGNAGTGITSSSNYTIDTQRPIASIVVADNALSIGEASLVTVTFNEAVTALTIADFSVANGFFSGLSSSDGDITWTATFTPTAGITDATNLIILNNAGVLDAAGNAGTGSTNSNNFAIDTQRPTATVVVSDNALLAGETSLVTITFSEAVSGFDNADLTVANGTLTTVNSSDGGITWTGTFTPIAGISDASNLITLNNTGIADLAGNSGTANTNSNNYAIDTQVPTLSAVNIVSSNAVPTIAKVGDIVTLTFTSSETITPVVNIAGHTVNPTATSNNWTASYTFTNTDIEGTVNYNIAFSDVVGNAGAPVTSGTGSVTFDQSAPAIPVGLAVIPGDTQLVLNWAANTETDLAKYRILSGNSANPATTLTDLPSGTTSYTHTGLTNGTTYYYRIQAIDKAGNMSAASTNVSGVPKADQTITFNAIATKTYGDAAFALGNANSSASLAVTYTATDPSVVAITGNTATIIKAGSTVITASQVGNASYNAAVNVPQTLTINPKALTITATNRGKSYGDDISFAGTEFSSAGLVNGNTVSAVTLNSTGAAATATVAGSTYPIVATAAIGTGLNNYSITYVNGGLIVNRKALTITADNKEKFAGTANPALTITYAGFVNGESVAVLTTQATVTTAAALNSPIGDYPITASGATAANYSITYVAGNLKIKPGAPTNISLAAVTLYENSAAATNAGMLSSTSDDPSATFTYTLVAGTGDTDNALFAISGNRINTTASLNFENKAIYKVRVRSTTQNALWLEKELSINLSDVNEIPTLAAINNQAICFTTAGQTVALNGITAGPETAQMTTLSVSSNNSGLFDDLTITGSGATGTLNYRIKAGAIAATATVTVTVKDNGGTANGGGDTYSRTFTITVNALPVVSINSDKGPQISKGERVFLTASGGTSYTWVTNSSIVNGLSSATLEVRPRETTTYTVTVTNASECSETKTFTLAVLEDYEKVKANNILSPNNDGYNDKWLIDNIDFYPNNEVKVFDKAGRIVYRKKGYDNSWDGTLNGSALVEGTYYYVIDFGTNRRVFKGFITVVRND